MLMTGYYNLRIFRGTELIASESGHNAIHAKNYLLNAGFRGSTQLSNWYLGLMDFEGFTQIVSADTHAAHPGWNEFVGYQAERKLWQPPAASDGVLLATDLRFECTENGEVLGAFLANIEDKGSTDPGTLWATIVFEQTYKVEQGIILEVDYSVEIIDANNHNN